MSERELLTQRDIWERYKISRTAQWKLRRDGELSYLDMSGRIAYLPEHIVEYLQKCERRANSKVKLEARKKEIEDEEAQEEAQETNA